MSQDDIQELKKVLDRIAYGVNVREHPTGVYHAIGEIRDNLKQLNGNLEKLNLNIEKIDTSSTALSINFILPVIRK